MSSDRLRRSSKFRDRPIKKSFAPIYYDCLQLLPFLETLARPPSLLGLLSILCVYLSDGQSIIVTMHFSLALLCSAADASTCMLLFLPGCLPPPELLPSCLSPESKDISLWHCLAAMLLLHKHSKLKLSKPSFVINRSTCEFINSLKLADAECVCNKF